jgi:hypothetical protein
MDGRLMEKLGNTFISHAQLAKSDHCALLTSARSCLHVIGMAKLGNDVFSVLLSSLPFDASTASDGVRLLGFSHTILKKPLASPVTVWTVKQQPGWLNPGATDELAHDFFLFFFD